MATLPLQELSLAPFAALALVSAVFLATDLALPRGTGDGDGDPRVPRHDLALRAGCTAALVLVLTALAEPLGARLAGMLAAFPVLASVLAAFTHAQAGAGPAADFLRGLTRGLMSFALFCFVVAVMLPSSGLAASFTTATLAALSAHAAGHLVSAGRPALSRT